MPQEFLRGVGRCSSYIRIMHFTFSTGVSSHFCCIFSDGRAGSKISVVPRRHQLSPHPTSKPNTTGMSKLRTGAHARRCLMAIGKQLKADFGRLLCVRDPTGKRRISSSVLIPPLWKKQQNQEKKRAVSFLRSCECMCVEAA